MIKQPRVEITFCIQCRWLLRDAWMAQELITTFPDELGETALLPGSGGDGHEDSFARPLEC